MKQLDSQLLWRQMQEGNREAFAALFKAYYSELKAYGMKLSGSHEFAQEAIQLLFLKIWESKHRIGAAKNPKSYLLRAYRTTILDLLSENKRRSTQLTDLSFQFNQQELPALADPSNSPLLQLVNQLSDKQREIIFLKFYNNLSYKEIAEVLEINYQTVRNYIAKSMIILRKKMNFSQNK